MIWILSILSAIWFLCVLGSTQNNTHVHYCFGLFILITGMMTSLAKGAEHSIVQQRTDYGVNAYSVDGQELVIELPEGVNVTSFILVVEPMGVITRSDNIIKCKTTATEGHLFFVVCDEGCTPVDVYFAANCVPAPVEPVESGLSGVEVQAYWVIGCLFLVAIVLAIYINCFAYAYDEDQNG